MTNVLFSAVLALVFPFLIKYTYVATNQYSQIPIIQSIYNPQYLTNDWYVTVSREFGPRSLFAWYMAKTAKILPLHISFFIQYIGTTFLIASASFWISRSMFREKQIAAFTTQTLLFANSITLGGNMLVTRDFSAPQLPLAIVLFAVALLWHNRITSASVLLSIAAYLHPLIGGEGAGLFFLSFFLSGKKSRRKMLVSGIFPFAVLTAPLVLLWGINQTAASISQQEMLGILAYMRNPHHYIPSSWPFEQYLRFFALLAISFAAYRGIKTHSRTGKPRVYILVSVLTLIFCAGGYLTTEIFPLYPLFILQPFRLTVFLFWLWTIMGIGEAFRLAKNASRFYERLPLLFLLIFLKLPLTIPLGTIHRTAFILLLLLILFKNRIPTGVFLIGTLVYFSLFSYHDRLNVSAMFPYPTDETEIAQWAKKETPKESVFLIPPEFEAFRLVSERAVVVDWKAFPFQPHAMKEWAERICRVTNSDPCQYASVSRSSAMEKYRELPYDIIIALGKRFGATYVVTERKQDKFPVLFHNSYYLYALPNF